MNHRMLRLVASMWVVGVGVGRAAAQTQGLHSTEDRPRFFMMAMAGKPPVDASDAPVLRRRVTAAMSKVPLGDALREIGLQVGVRFAISPEKVPVGKLVSLQASKITLGAALFELLAGLGLDVQFSRDGRGAAIVQRRSIGATGRLVGRVTDGSTAKGVVGAEVILHETQWRTATDTNGYYFLVEVDAGDYTLTVRRFGYGKQSRKVTVRAEREDTVNVTLEPVAAALEELVTTATGQQRRRDLGNAITTINADSVLRTAPIRSLTDLLENRVTGLTVQHTTGAPGDPSKLRLRGLTSVYRSNDPVVIVDGVRVYAVQSEARSGNLTNLDPGIRQSNGQMKRANPVDMPAPSPLDQIDPNIIDKIEVFKGPSAATLYGADAANGVIVITTKRGRAGPTTWQASIVRGRTVTPGEWPTGYYHWGHDMFIGSPRLCTLLNSYCVSDSLVQFQTLNEPNLTLLGQGERTALSLTSSGGTQAVQFSVTGTYTDEIGLLTMPAFEAERFRTRFTQDPPAWMQRPHRLKTWQVSSNIRANLSPTMEVTLSTSLGRSEQQRTTLERQLSRLMGMYVDTINRVYYQPNSAGYALNETADLLADYYTRQTASALTFTTGLNAGWRPRSWFTASAQAGLNVIPRHDALVLPSGLVTANDSGAVVRGTGRSVQSNFNVQGALRKPIGMGFVFTTNLGANLTTTSTNDLVISASGLVRGTSSAMGARRVNVLERDGDNSVFGWYIEPSITGQRIALSTGLRLDGGSAYGARVTSKSGLLGGLLGLPKLNGSWVISEEPWFPFNSLFSSLRLRGAYGQAQVQPGPSDRLRTYAGTINQLTSQLLLDRLGNSRLRPERATEFEGGLDADLLDSRLSVELTAYRKLQVDALMTVGIPMSVHGGGTQFINVGNIRNTGLELTLGMTAVQSAAFTWRTQVNYSRNANILTKLGDGVKPNKATGLVEGYPVGGRWARPILGYSDQNGDSAIEPGEIQVGDSLMYMGQLLPAYTSALSTDIQLFGGAVGVAFAFNYVGGATQINQTARTNWVLAPELVDPNTSLQEQVAVVASTRATNPTDYGLMQEVSTLQFNSLSVSYRAPMRVARLLGAQQLSVAVQGSNLGMHTNYRGKDPNVNAWSPGEQVVDTGQLPQPRTWQVRVDVRY